MSIRSGTREGKVGKNNILEGGNQKRTEFDGKS